MSFYGHSFFEFSKLFSRFTFSNKGNKKKKAAELSDAAATIQDANERWEQLNFETGNQWIGFSEIEDETKKGIVISHNKPSDEISSEIHGFTLVDRDKVDEEISPLTPGAVIKTTQADIDDAGHCAKVTEKFYELPSTGIVLNKNKTLSTDPNDSKLHFSSDKFIVFETTPENDAFPTDLKFTHAKSENKEQSVGIFRLGKDTETTDDVQQLEPGDYFTTSLVTYDECGHVSGIETKTLQLTSAANVNEEFRENIEINSKAIEDINKFLEENLPETYAKLSWTGELKDLVENTGDSTITSITSAIGSLSNLTKKLKEAWSDMYWDSYTKDISIYNIEQALVDMVTALVKAYNDAVNARAAITGLTARIDTIDKYLNINSN